MFTKNNSKFEGKGATCQRLIAWNVTWESKFQRRVAFNSFTTRFNRLPWLELFHAPFWEAFIRRLNSARGSSSFVAFAGIVFVATKWWWRRRRRLGNSAITDSEVEDDKNMEPGVFVNMSFWFWREWVSVDIERMLIELMWQPWRISCFEVAVSEFAMSDTMSRAACHQLSACLKSSRWFSKPWPRSLILSATSSASWVLRVVITVHSGHPQRFVLGSTAWLPEMARHGSVEANLGKPCCIL